MSGRAIFIAELDDDYQKAANLTTNALKRRIRCYFLLAPSLLIHPAYIWQARTTHTLVTSSMGEIFGPPYSQIALGDSPDLNSYMQQRMEALAGGRRQQITPELLQYQRWGSDLVDEANKLDARFNESPGISFQASRDKMFRDLLSRDLSTADVAGTSLRDLIRLHYFSRGEEPRATNATSALRSFIKDAKLVSLDSISAYLNRRGLGELVSSKIFYNRMLVLYYRANVDEHYVVAGLPTLDPNDPTIHPYDPFLFWGVIEHVFGMKAARVLGEDDSPAARDFVLHLKQDSDWSDFVTKYHNLRQGMDATLSLESRKIANDLEISADYAQLKLLPRVWREQKKELIGTILGIGFTAPTVTEPHVVSYGGAIVTVFSSFLALKPIRRFRDEYEQNSLRRLKQKLRTEIRILTRK